MMRVLCAAVACLALASCSPVSLATKVAGAALVGGPDGGTDVNANVQAGQKNAQTIGASKSSDQKIHDVTAGTVKQSSGDSTVEAAEVQTVIVNQYPAWLIIAFAAALFLDSPLRWPGQIWSGLRKIKS